MKEPESIKELKAMWDVITDPKNVFKSVDYKEYCKFIELAATLYKLLVQEKGYKRDRAFESEILNEKKAIEKEKFDQAAFTDKSGGGERSE